MGLTPAYNHKSTIFCPRSKKLYHNYIGIDISKYDFHVAVHGSKLTESFSNDKEGFKEFYTKYKEHLTQALVVLEVTGGHEIVLIDFLQKKDVAVHRANTRIVKSFIRSTGKLGKSDRIDSLGLARYGCERFQELGLYVPPSNSEKELLQLTKRKIELKQMLVQEKNRHKSPDNEFVKASCETVIKSLQDSIKQIEERIKILLEESGIIKEKVEILAKEIDGVGEATAIDLLNTMPELGKIDRRSIASLSGTAPHPYESGKKIGYRSTQGGREIVKPILFMAAMAAARSKGKLGEFYRSLIAKGKKPMVAITALMRKIIVIANAKIRDFEKSLNAKIASN